jgi:hypothetical protein
MGGRPIGYRILLETSMEVIEAGDFKPNRSAALKQPVVSPPFERDGATAHPEVSPTDTATEIKTQRDRATNDGLKPGEVDTFMLIAVLWGASMLAVASTLSGDLNPVANWLSGPAW